MMRIGIIFFLMLSSLMIFSCGDLLSDSEGGSVSTSTSNTNNGSGPAILLTTPANGEDTVIYTPTLVWTNSESATPTSYTITWATDSSFKQNNVVKTIQGDQTSYTIPTSEKLLSGTTYYWLVLSSSGKKSVTHSFKTASANAPVITFVSPVNTGSDESIRPELKLVWTSQNVPTASTYTITWGTDNPPTATNGGTANVAAGTTEYTVQQATGQTKGVLDQNTTYYWQVTSSDGAKSSVFQFTTEKIIPTAPTGVTVTPQEVTFTFGAIGYRKYIVPPPEFNENIDVSWTSSSDYATEYEVYYEGERQQNGITTTSKLVPVGLKENRDITVVAKNSAGSSPASTVYQHLNALCTTRTTDDIGMNFEGFEVLASRSGSGFNDLESRDLESSSGFDSLPPKKIDRGYRTFANPSWLVPIATTTYRSFAEDETPGNLIHTLEGQDTDGDALTFSIVTQDPTSPPFELESVSGSFKVPSGTDYEVIREYTFVFGVRDGSTTTNSVPYTVYVENAEELNIDFISRSSASGMTQSDGAIVLDVTTISLSPNMWPVRFQVSKDGTPLTTDIDAYPTLTALGQKTLSGLAAGKYFINVVDNFGYTQIKGNTGVAYDQGIVESRKYLKVIPLYVCYP